MFASSLMSPALFHFQNAFVIFVQALLFCCFCHFRTDAVVLSNRSVSQFSARDSHFLSSLQLAHRLFRCVLLLLVVAFAFFPENCCYRENYLDE